MPADRSWAWSASRVPGSGVRPDDGAGIAAVVRLWWVVVFGWVPAVQAPGKVHGDDGGDDDGDQGADPGGVSVGQPGIEQAVRCLQQQRHDEMGGRGAAAHDLQVGPGKHQAVDHDGDAGVPAPFRDGTHHQAEQTPTQHDHDQRGGEDEHDPGQWPFPRGQHEPAPRLRDQAPNVHACSVTDTRARPSRVDLP